MLIDKSTYLGIELGSTRIKAVLIDSSHVPIAFGESEWENQLENGCWTYSMDSVWAGIRVALAKLKIQTEGKCGSSFENIGAIGISAMMHGYLPFDAAGNQLVAFRTWRNTTTEQAAGLLTKEFGFNIPQRWSIAHLYQAILNGEDHVQDIAFITTLAGYVHWRLTGEKVLGIGDVSGMFPVRSQLCDYDNDMLEKFERLISGKNYKWRLRDILPKPLIAGCYAGVMTAEGARLLDPSGSIASGIVLCPPEGDAGTGMAATNSVIPRTGNVSAGTSIFAMAALEKPLSGVYPEVDIVTTPSGSPVAMVHCNNCSSDIDDWIKMMCEATAAAGANIDRTALYDALYRFALEGEPDCGGLLSYNYLSGEPVTAFDQGRPLFARMPGSRLSFANFARTLIYSAIATLKIGMDILFEKENIKLDMLTGHGGMFKARETGQRLMAGALGAPVAVMSSAGEGGAWGIALLAAYMIRGPGVTLEDYLAEKVFNRAAGSVVYPDERDADGFAAYMERYRRGLVIERAAVENLT